MNSKQVQSLINTAVAAIPQPQWIKITKTYTDFATAGASRTITIFTPSANQIITGVRMLPTTAFTGGLIATYTISAGQISTVDLLAASSVFTVPPVTFAANNVISTSLASPPVVTATAIATIGLLNAATQGSVNIWLLISTLP